MEAAALMNIANWYKIERSLEKPFQECVKSYQNFQAVIKTLAKKIWNYS